MEDLRQPHIHNEETGGTGHGTFPLGEGRTRIAALGMDAIVTVLKKTPSAYPKDNFTAYFDLDKLGPGPPRGPDLPPG
jgi:hypothetical protein